MKRPSRAGLTRLALAAVATIVLVVGLVEVSTPVEIGDTYCGRVLYDSSHAGACASAMSWRLTLGVTCGLLALGLLVTGAVIGVHRPRRWTRLAGALLWSAAGVALLVAVNRFLQPTRSEWCGSVLNRHRSYEPALERRCDQLLTPYRNTAIGSIVVASAALAAGVALWRRRPG